MSTTPATVRPRLVYLSALATTLVATLVAMLVATLVATLVGATPATAAPDDDRVTWSVEPADKAGPDGRRVIDLELEPGESATEHVAITNFSASPVTFALTANDGYLTERGSFDMLPSDVAPTDGGSWVTITDEVAVAPDETVVVPFEVVAPDDATPGDHPAGVAASIRSGEGEVQVENRVGVRVNLRVPGEVVAALSAEVTGASYEQSVDPTAPGTAVVSYTVTNEGTVALRAAPVVTATSTLGGSESRASADEREVLPGGRFERTVRVDGVWPLGPTDVELVVEATLPEASTVDVAPPAPSTANATLWAVPVVHLVLLVVLALLVLVAVDTRRRRRARLEALLEQARAQGRAEAAAR